MESSWGFTTSLAAGGKINNGCCCLQEAARGHVHAVSTHLYLTCLNAHFKLRKGVANEGLPSPRLSSFIYIYLNSNMLKFLNREQSEYEVRILLHKVVCRSLFWYGTYYFLAEKYSSGVMSQAVSFVSEGTVIIFSIQLSLVFNGEKQSYRQFRRLGMLSVEMELQVTTPVVCDQVKLKSQYPWLTLIFHNSLRYL